MDLPNQIGSLSFCSVCGNLLDLPSGNRAVRCAQCGTEEESSSDGKEVVTRSHPRDYPSPLRQKRMASKTLDQEGQQKELATAGGAATIEEACPKCGNPEMRFNTVQLRSADEGSTVFYTCPKCSYKYSTNN